MTDAAQSPEPDPLEPVREAILLAAVEHAAFDGWTDGLIERAADEAEIPQNQALLAFPGGARELVEYFSTWADAKMVEALSTHALDNLRIRDKIALAVRLRLEVCAPYREAVRRAVTFETVPVNSPSAAALIARTSDEIWRAIGDQSHDFNFYTKRVLLGGVYSASLLYWLGDGSPGTADSWAFIDRRIDNVMQFQKMKGEVEKVAGRLPNPVKILAGLRYPGPSRRF